MTRAIVFAYHDVGVRCLKTLLARGVEVALVVTHEDRAGEEIWFDSVRATAEAYGLPCITPPDPNAEDVLARVREARPDLLFSFYYRSMLGAALLAVAPRGAWNLHGSLLPKYRGRVPVNWAILHGETETGATLHAMTIRPDAGAIVDQLAVPILPDDTAREVFGKICVAAEIVLWRSLPGLADGSARTREQNLDEGSYFGGRRPEDGRIDASMSARRLHDLVRAVSHPYPGAFADTAHGRLFLWRTLRAGATRTAAPRAAELRVIDGELSVSCADGERLRVLDATLDGRRLDAAALGALLGERPLCLGRSAAPESE